MQSQEQTNWCWAAVASSVCAYYAARGSGALRSQCQIATQFLGLECCITPLPPPSEDWPGNKRFTLQVPLDVLGHFSPPIVRGPLDPRVIAQELERQRPVCCQIEWGPNDGHFAVIVGCDFEHNDVTVRDPAGTLSGTFPYNGANTFPGGRWTETYLSR